MLSNTEREIDKLTFVKRITECALAAKEMPVNVVMECLAIREKRVSIDLVRDDIESELNKVLKLLTKIFTHNDYRK